MKNDVYKVVVDGKEGEQCYWVFGADKEQAIKKGKLLYGARDIVYGYRAELLRQVTIQKDDLEKFLEEIGIVKDDVLRYFDDENEEAIPKQRV